MGNYRLTEITVALIEKQIKDNITASLSDLRIQRGDAAVTLESPREYFRYTGFQGYRTPCIYTVVRGMDIRNSDGSNHINALCDVIVGAVVEDRVERLVVIKAQRYQAALMKCLHEVTLTSADSVVRLFSRVQNIAFSANENIKAPDSSEAVFRKEVSLKLDVEHIEKLE